LAEQAAHIRWVVGSIPSLAIDFLRPSLEGLFYWFFINNDKQKSLYAIFYMYTLSHYPMMKHRIGKPYAWAIVNDRALHKPEELVFPALSQSKTSATQYFRTWTKAAGIDKKLGWHTARHTFAVLALEGGADLYTVSKLLGHTDLQTTQAYAKATDTMKRAAVDALSEIDLTKNGEIVPMRRAEGREK